MFLCDIEKERRNFSKRKFLIYFHNKNERELLFERKDRDIEIHINKEFTHTHIHTFGVNEGDKYTWTRTSIRLDTFSNKIRHVNEWIFEQLMFFTWKNCSHCSINPFSFILIWMAFRTFAFNDGKFATCWTNSTNKYEN